jgi:conserved domain protein
MAEFKYEIKEELGVISEGNKGWKKELNLISWNGAEPKYDLRDWGPNHDKMGKGITLNSDETQELYKLLSKIVEL